MLKHFISAWSSMHSLRRKFVFDENGVTAIEYGLIVGGIAIAILATVFAIGDDLDNLFTSFQTRLSNAFS